MQLKGSKTAKNLADAFAGESQANRRYLYFAAKADVEGAPDVAAVFRSTAEGETGHAHGHLELMLRATDYGALILPPSPAFYHGHQTLDEVIDQTVGRALDCLGLQHELVPRWGPPA